MSLWTSSVITLLLLQTAPSQVEPANVENHPVEEVIATANIPPRLPFENKDWSLTQAYVDVFDILSKQNSCSRFYGGPAAATIVLNEFVRNVKPQTLFREISFQMEGKPRLIRDYPTGVFYRLFDRAAVNSNGSFYQRRLDVSSKYPKDVGSFFPGSRPARALILLHELAHLIQGENGKWLIPDDGYDGWQSTENTLHIEQVCRRELKALK
jgi:hypothetical protein